MKIVAPLHNSFFENRIFNGDVVKFNKVAKVALVVMGTLVLVSAYSFSATLLPIAVMCLVAAKIIVFHKRIPTIAMLQDYLDIATSLQDPNATPGLSDKERNKREYEFLARGRDHARNLLENDVRGKIDLRLGELMESFGNLEKAEVHYKEATYKFANRETRIAAYQALHSLKNQKTTPMARCETQVYFWEAKVLEVEGNDETQKHAFGNTLAQAYLDLISFIKDPTATPKLSDLERTMEVSRALMVARKNSNGHLRGKIGLMYGQFREHDHFRRDRRTLFGALNDYQSAQMDGDRATRIAACKAILSLIESKGSEFLNDDERQSYIDEYQFRLELAEEGTNFETYEGQEVDEYLRRRDERTRGHPVELPGHYDWTTRPAEIDEDAFTEDILAGTS